MTSAAAARVCLFTCLPPSLVAAGALLFASLGGCSVAVAPEDGKPQTPQESGPAPDPADAPEPQDPPNEGPLRVGLTADTRAVLEGQPATFTVTISGGPSRDPVRVDYTVSGTARAEADFTVPGGTTTIAAGKSRASITISTLADNESERQETIAVALVRASTPIGTVEVDSSPAIMRIAEPDTVLVSVAPATAREGEQAAFAVTVSHALRSDVTVRWEPWDESAAAGADYTAEAGREVVFRSGSTQRKTVRGRDHPGPARRG